jgi:hypothetical protein
MEIVNATGMTVGYTMGVEPSGRELLVVVVKGTFAIPPDGGTPELLAAQRPLITADTFTGAPGYSAPAEEIDFAPRKLRCDVLVSGSAHAPHGEPAQRVAVGVRLGHWKKVFSVVGDRQWEAGLSGCRASLPLPFVTKAITYDVAFGGVDERHEDPARHAAYMANPVGRGWHRNLQARFVDGAPLPNTEALDRPCRCARRRLRADGARAARQGLVGAAAPCGHLRPGLDRQHLPFLPADFRDDYYQAAPADQQIAYPLGGEEMALANLTPEGHTRFHLPSREVPVTFFHRKGGHEETRAVLDTIAIHADRGFMTLAWRSTRAAAKEHVRDVQHPRGHEVARLVARPRARQDLPPVAGRAGARPARSAAGGGMSATPHDERRAHRHRRTGLVTGVGLDAAATCAAIRGAIDNFQQTAFRDRNGEWIMGCEVALEAPWRGEKKLLAMAARAIGECLEGFDRAACEATPLLVCLAEAGRPGRVVRSDAMFLEALAARTGLRLSSAVRGHRRGPCLGRGGAVPRAPAAGCVGRVGSFAGRGGGERQPARPARRWPTARRATGC